MTRAAMRWYLYFMGLLLKINSPLVGVIAIASAIAASSALGGRIAAILGSRMVATRTATDKTTPRAIPYIALGRTCQAVTTVTDEAFAGMRVIVKTWGGKTGIDTKN